MPNPLEALREEMALSIANDTLPDAFLDSYRVLARQEGDTTSTVVLSRALEIRQERRKYNPYQDIAEELRLAITDFWNHSECQHSAAHDLASQALNAIARIEEQVKKGETEK